VAANSLQSFKRPFLNYFRAIELDHCGFSFYDALIVSAAIRARCDILYSEDMLDGLVIDGGLRIVNAFQISKFRSE